MWVKKIAKEKIMDQEDKKRYIKLLFSIGVVATNHGLFKKSEEIILVITAMFVLISSMLEPMVSSIIAVCSLVIFLGYNFLTKGV